MQELIILLNQMKRSQYMVRYSIINKSLPQSKEVCKDVIKKIIHGSEALPAHNKKPHLRVAFLVFVFGKSLSYAWS